MPEPSEKPHLIAELVQLRGIAWMVDWPLGRLDGHSRAAVLAEQKHAKAPTSKGMLRQEPEL